jgi:transcription-repair coupling factor (superfamily II helicase)
VIQTISLKNIYKKVFESAGRVQIAGVPAGMDARVLAELARQAGARGILHVVRDEPTLDRLAETLAFFAEDVEVLRLPAWDCLPYERVSPHGEAVARRIDALARLASVSRGKGPRILLATVSAALQRLPPRTFFAEASLDIALEMRLEPERLVTFLGNNGFQRSETVMEAGEYAVRGGIVDVFPPGAPEPVRLDFFGDVVEGMRRFDPLTQRTTEKLERIELKPASEMRLDDESVACFRSGYVECFGAYQGNDPLYESITSKRRHAGMEHWLPLFHTSLETLFDYVSEAVVVLDTQANEAVRTRFETITDHYQARLHPPSVGLSSSLSVYRPLSPERLYLEPDEWERRLAEKTVVEFVAFAAAPPEGGAAGKIIDAGGRPALGFAATRAAAKVNSEANPLDAVRQQIEALIEDGRRVVVAGYSAGSRDRLRTLLEEHGLGAAACIGGWKEVRGFPRSTVSFAVLGLEDGFDSPDLALVTEQDILGDRLVRPSRKRRLAENFIAEASSLEPGDLVVHVEHGVGRYDGLQRLEVADAPHDCLRILYEGGDRLLVPVENVEALSRYGSGEADVRLDRLGGTVWQARRARLKKRLKDMAEKLIAIAARRELREAPKMTPMVGAFEEFCARFPYPETEDQLRAIEDTLKSLAAGQPMDRLVCGDVGFGKTEVAMRAAFVAVLSGAQVALVVPTTLLARQHAETFRQRFAGLPVRVAQISRIVPAAQVRIIKEELRKGTIDIIIGTHALLAKNVGFHNLGLLIVDEEQHFGVAHKERLKALKADVHVLTLTATPIPRTLQLALTGVKELSLIATPPIDRLAVRTFVLPFDPVVIREAIHRELYRGGQVFYVCPRVKDLGKVEELVRELVPEAKLAVAHGRMGAKQLEDIISAFYDGVYNVLVSTNIVESGLDIPNANTLIVHRAHLFGLSQLYQLRGRIGRSKARAYAYLTLPDEGQISKAATKRLTVMHSLDTLGAGFTLASHDLDIRGAGNLLGEEQSGHIREVGIELYQHMLEEAVAGARGTEVSGADDEWTPQISMGAPVLIPENYVTDLGLRLALYRRLAALVERPEIDSFAAELIDRFGPLPREVDNLLGIVAIKGLCREAGVERVEAGAKGAVITFHGDSFANPAGIVEFIQAQAGTAKLRPDHRLVYRRDWTEPEHRLTGLQYLLSRLVKIAAASEKAA